MSPKAENPQVRVDAATAARLNDYISKVWNKTKVRPLAREIASAAINAHLDDLEKQAKKKRGA